MIDIRNDIKIIPFSLAKKLKDLGFDEFCCAHYLKSGDLNYNTLWKEDSGVFRRFNILPTMYIDAPTIYQVIDWFSDRGLFLTVEPFPSFSSSNKIVWNYKIKRNSDGANMETIESTIMFINNTDAYLEGIKELIKLYIEDANKN